MCSPSFGSSDASTLGMAGAGAASQMAGAYITGKGQKKAQRKQANFLAEERAARNKALQEQEAFMDRMRAAQQGYTGKQTVLQGQADTNLNKLISGMGLPAQQAATQQAQGTINQFLQGLIKPAVANSYGVASAPGVVKSAQQAAVQQGEDRSRQSASNLAVLQALKQVNQGNAQNLRNNASSLSVLKDYAAGDDRMKRAIANQAVISSNAFGNRMNAQDATRDAILDTMKFRGSTAGDALSGFGDIMFQQSLMSPGSSGKPAFAPGHVPVPVMKPKAPARPIF